VDTEKLASTSFEKDTLNSESSFIPTENIDQRSYVSEILFEGGE